MLNDPLLLLALVVLALAAAWSFGLFGRPKPQAPAAVEVPRTYEAPAPTPAPPPDAAALVVAAMRQVEDEGLARRLRDGAGLFGLSNLARTVNLAGREAGLATQAELPFELESAPATAKKATAKPKAAAKK